MNRNENMTGSNWDGKAPRTLSEAFGQNTSPLLQAAQGQDRSWIASAVIVAIMALLYACWAWGSSHT